jgi:hypothetical protein
MSEVYLDVVHTLKALQEGIERNLTEIPSNTRKLLKEVATINKEAKENKEEENRKLDNITILSTLNLLQGNETKKDTLGMKSDLDELKLTIKEINQRVIEYGIFQEDQKWKEIQGEEVKVKKERKKEEASITLQKYKPKRPPSDSSSSSSSSDEGERERDIVIKDKLKERVLIRPNITTNILDINFIKKALAETENGIQFGELLDEKGYEFTVVHKMEVMHGDEDIYEILKEYGCLPVPDGLQYPYCKWNKYNGSRKIIERKLSKHMEKVHLISNNNHALNILFNIYGTDW